MLFPQTQRVNTKNDVIDLTYPKANEYYLNCMQIDDVGRILRLFRNHEGLFGISAITDERMILKNVINNPEDYQTRIHTINGVSAPLKLVYSIEKKYPKIRSIPLLDLEAGKVSKHSQVHYKLRVGNKAKCQLSRIETNLNMHASIMGF